MFIKLHHMSGSNRQHSNDRRYPQTDERGIHQQIDFSV